MLPAYYGLLRMMCQQSRVFTRHVAQHQNLQWAFKNITPHPTQYPAAVEELFKLMQLMVMKNSDATEAEQREVCTFRRATLTTYLQVKCSTIFDFIELFCSSVKLDFILGKIKGKLFINTVYF